jgi:hypothetical protein
MVGHVASLERRLPSRLLAGYRKEVQFASIVYVKPVGKPALRLGFGFVFFKKRNVYADDLGLFRNFNVQRPSRREP